MSKNNNLIVASFLRPRGFAILFAGLCFSVALAILVKWWLLFGGLIMSLAGYRWSVVESRSNPLFIETMSKQSLSAFVSDESRLEVLASTGSRHLIGEAKEQMKLVAREGVEAIGAFAKTPAEYSSHLEDIPEKVCSMVCVYEKMAIELGSLQKSNDDKDRIALLSEAMDKTKATVSAILKKGRIIEGGTSDLKRLSEITSSVVDDIHAVESVVTELKLLE